MSNFPFKYTPIEKIETLLEGYYDALEALSFNASYSLSGRTITRAALPDIKRIVEELEYAKAVRTGQVIRRTTTLVTFNQ